MSAQLSQSFKEAVVAVLASVAEKFHLSNPAVGEDQVVAAAAVDGFPGRLQRHLVAWADPEAELLKIMVRNCCYCGSSGSLTNRTVVQFLRRLFMLPVEGSAELDDTQLVLLTLLAETFRSELKTTDDLVALVVAGSNDVATRTRAGLDARDGEVFCDISLAVDDFRRPPEGLEDAIGALLQHGALIARFDENMRNAFAPDHAPSPRTIEQLAQAFSKNGKETGAEARQEVLAL